MSAKRKVFIQKSSVCRIGAVAAAAFFCLSASAYASLKEDIDGLVPDSVQTKVRELSAPVFDPAKLGTEAPSADPVLDKLRKNHKKFFKKQQNRRAKFINDIRSKNYPPDKLQKKLSDFSQAQEREARKFLAKEQQKLQEHQEKLKEEEETQ